MLGIKIKKIRKKLKLNQREFAKMLNICQSSIHAYELDKRIPNGNILNRIYKFAKSFGYDLQITDLFGNEDIK